MGKCRKYALIRYSDEIVGLSLYMMKHKPTPARLYFFNKSDSCSRLTFPNN